MKNVTVKKVSEILDICTEIDANGCYKIKTLSELEAQGFGINSFDKIELWRVKSHHRKAHGSVFFGSSTWYSYEVTSRHLPMIENDSEIALQLRIFALVSHLYGCGEEFQRVKLSTLQTEYGAFKKMGVWLLYKNYASFHQLEHLEEIKLRTLLTEYVSDCVLENNPNNKPRVYGNCFNPLRSLGLIGERTSSYLNEIIDALSTKTSAPLSHPIIPTDIVQNIAKYAKNVVNICSEKLGELELANNQMLDFLVNKYNKKSTKVRNAADIFSYGARRSGVNVQLIELHKYFVDLRLAVYIHVLLFTGMRYNEALSCVVGCTNKSSTDDGVYLIEALTFKTVETTFLDTWVTNKDTVEAIHVLEKYIAIVEKRGEIILDNFRDVLFDYFIHNIEVGMNENRLFGSSNGSATIGYAKSGEFVFFDAKSEYLKDDFNLTVTEKSLNELERLDLNYSSIRGSKRGNPYKKGDLLRISSHMFRHTFAYFVVANKLGELDDIMDQFKHLNIAMTRVYGDKGILSHEEIIQLVDGYEGLMTDTIALELVEQAQKQSLRGGAGKQINKAARELVIGVTDSNAPDANVISQVHFKDVKELARFLSKNIQSIRGLPQGYCTSGDECKIKGAAVPSGCVYCKSFIVADSHKVHWQAMRKRAQKKLAIIESMPEEAQKEHELFAIAFRKDLQAANEVLNATDDLDINGNREANFE